ncbi:ATP-binding protein [Uliginosibacterium sp. H1]|uniref:ATP-binding protein n=1 Tax=Uliginosibacterium sp. H1 TaxID=3114757 RepID=UPI002E184D69|nr:ATP-binding protein [Uliginosibacterium sp. H1]
MPTSLDEGLALRLARPWSLALALGLLHLGLLQDVMTPVGRGLLLAHLGAVLAWQPLVSGARQLRPLELVLGLAAAAAAGWWMSWGLALVWMLMLAGMLGGKLFRHARARERVPYWLALGYLVLAMLGLALPQLLPGHSAPRELLAEVAAWGGLPLLGLMLLTGRARPEPRGPQALDFVGSLVIMLVLTGLMLGAVALMYIDDRGYVEALLRSLMAMVVGLLVLGWAWNPRQDFGGLGLAVSRHLLGGAQPFERWLEAVADSALREDAPATLVERACQHMLLWPSLRAVRWQVTVPAQQQGAAGDVDAARHWQPLTQGALRLELGTRQALGPSQLWQMDLMLRVLAEFHRAAVQAQRLQSMAYVRAVHETGARVTHEVKNLLQSLDTLCFAINEADASRSQQLDALIRRQLPQISERLHLALARIREPAAPAAAPAPAAGWWGALQERYVRDDLSFSVEEIPAGALGAARLPAALFDAVADNLLRNVADKRAAATHTSVRVSVVLGVAGEVCRLSVEDDGAPIPAERALNLMGMPLPSASGFGVGLYQCAQLAQNAGYRLSLAENREGCVRFVLSPASVPAPAA